MADPESLEAAYLLSSSAFLRSMLSPELHFTRDLLERVTATARKHGDRYLEAQAVLGHASATVYAERYATRELLTQFRHAGKIAAEIREEFLELRASLNVVVDLLILGRTEEASREAEAMHAKAKWSGDRIAELHACRALRLVAWHESRWDDLVTLCDRLIAISPPRWSQSGMDLQYRAAARFQTGENAEGFRDLDLLLGQAPEHARTTPDILFACANAVADGAYLSADPRLLGEAESCARKLLASDHATHYARTHAHRALGLVAVCRHDTPAAEAEQRHLSNALESNRREERPLLAWHHDLGVLARMLGRPDDAVAHFERTLRRPGAAASRAAG